MKDAHINNRTGGCSRNDTAARKAKTAKTVQPNQRIYSRVANSKRGAGNQQRQTEIRPSFHAANGFLSTTFLPKMEAGKKELSVEKTQIMENDFYSSLQLMAAHYKGFEPADTRTLGYPYNIALSFWEAENYLKRKVKNAVNLRLMQDGKGKIFFLNEEKYNTGMSLYYIPVLPLYLMLHNRKTKKAASLLLSVFAYLYHIADIPYYRQEDSYIFWLYDMLADWFKQSECVNVDDDEEDSGMQEMKIATYVGDRIEKKLRNKKNLAVFETRIAAFQPKNDFDRECLKLAKKIYLLYCDEPSTNIFIHAKSEQEGTEQDSEIISMEKYISFIADSKGKLYDMLCECVNGEFNECSETEEPVILKKFDGSPVADCNLDFENRLFPLIGNLCELLCGA